MYRSVKRQIRVLLGIPFLLTAIACAVIVFINIQTYRESLKEKDSNHSGFFNAVLLGKIFAGTLNGAFIYIMNYIYGRVALKLTNWENHRTESEHESALAVKTFIFQYINSFISPLYAIFFERSIENACIHVGAVMISKQFLDTVVGTILPVLKMQYRQQELLRHVCESTKKGGLNMTVEGIERAAEERMTTLKDLWSSSPRKKKMFSLSKVKPSPMKSIDMTDSKRRKFEDTTGSKNQLPFRYSCTIDHINVNEVDILDALRNFYMKPNGNMVRFYTELAIQYGFVTMFTAIFPLAPVVAMFNNTTQIRYQVMKCYSVWRRPEPQGCNGIGHGWIYIYEIMAFSAVIANVGILFLLSSTADDVISSAFLIDWIEESSTRRLTAAFGVFAFMTFIKAVVMSVVDDTAGKSRWSDKAERSDAVVDNVERSDAVFDRGL